MQCTLSVRIDAMALGATAVVMVYRAGPDPRQERKDKGSPLLQVRTRSAALKGKSGSPLSGQKREGKDRQSPMSPLSLSLGSYCIDTTDSVWAGGHCDIPMSRVLPSAQQRGGPPQKREETRGGLRNKHPLKGWKNFGLQGPGIPPSPLPGGGVRSGLPPSLVLLVMTRFHIIRVCSGNAPPLWASGPLGPLRLQEVSIVVGLPRGTERDREVEEVRPSVL